MNAYATSDDVEDFVSEDVWLAVVDLDVDRLAARATELIDSKVRAAFAIDDDGIPTESTIAEAFRDAVCAQIEFWMEVGEEHDTAGMAGRQVSVGHFSIDHLPPELAPRARRILDGQGLLAIATGGLVTGCCW